jgi:hypothetical protein
LDPKVHLAVIRGPQTVFEPFSDSKRAS